MAGVKTHERRRRTRGRVSDVLPSTNADIASPLASYATRFHDRVGDRHHVASPLGAWLLLALASTAATGSARAGFVDVLGVEVDDAAALARALLSTPHPLVGAAGAVWNRPDVETAELRRWLSTLSDVVETGDVPAQADADEWARRHSLGLIDRFPLEVTPQVKVLLASAIATRVSWVVPFDRVPAHALGWDSAWSTGLTHVLRTPLEPRSGGSMHAVSIASTATAGDVAVHTTLRRSGARSGPGITGDVGDRGA